VLIAIRVVGGASIWHSSHHKTKSPIVPSLIRVTSSSTAKIRTRNHSRGTIG
jgi:hypothetical protein